LGEGIIMSKIWYGFQALFTAIGGFVGWFIGGVDGLIHALIGFIILDYIMGIIRAMLEKNLSSRIGAKGILKKIVIFMIVGAAHLVDTYIFQIEGDVMRTAVIFFYIANEGISLLENASAIGLPVPAKLKDVLVQIHKKQKKDSDKDKTGD